MDVRFVARHGALAEALAHEIARPPQTRDPSRPCVRDAAPGSAASAPSPHCTRGPSACTAMTASGGGGRIIASPRRPAPQRCAGGSRRAASRQSGCGLKARTLPLDVGGAQAPVDACLGLADLGGVGRAAPGAAECHPCGRRRGDPIPRGACGAPSSASASCSVAAVSLGRMVHGSLQEDGAGIQGRLHAHEGDAGLAVAGEERALNGRGAAPARQQRGVHIDAAEPRRIEQRLRQNEPVGDHDQHVRAPGAKLSKRRRRPAASAAARAAAARRAPPPSRGLPRAAGRGRAADPAG